MNDTLAAARVEALEQAQERAVAQIAERLVTLGDTNVLAIEVGARAAGQAMHWLTERAPEELRLSWPMVIAWHRLGKAYERAEKLGDVGEMVKTARAQAQLVTDRY